MAIILVLLGTLTAQVWAAGPTVAWTDQFGGELSNELYALAVAADGTIYAGGWSTNDLDNTHAPGEGGFIRKYAPDGSIAWTRQFGPVYPNLDVTDLAVDRRGRIVVGGSRGLAAGGFIRVFRANGRLRWKKNVGGRTAFGWMTGVATDQRSRVFAVGSLDGDAFIRAYRRGGSLAWSRSFGTREDDSASAVAVDHAGRIIVVGETSGRLGGRQRGFGDVFVRTFRQDGSVAWTRQFGTRGEDLAFSVAIDARDRVIVVGTTEGDLAGTSKGRDDAFVRVYRPDGRRVWSRQFGTVRSDYAHSVAVDDAKNIFVVGYTTGDLGGSKGREDAFVRMFRPDGRTIWTQQFGTTMTDIANAVAAFGKRHIVVGGVTTGHLSGSGPERDYFDAFVRSFRP